MSGHTYTHTHTHTHTHIHTYTHTYTHDNYYSANHHKCPKFQTAKYLKFTEIRDHILYIYKSYNLLKTLQKI